MALRPIRPTGDGRRESETTYVETSTRYPEALWNAGKALADSNGMLISELMQHLLRGWATRALDAPTIPDGDPLMVGRSANRGVRHETGIWRAAQARASDGDVLLSEVQRALLWGVVTGGVAVPRVEIVYG